MNDAEEKQLNSENKEKDKVEFIIKQNSLKQRIDDKINKDKERVELRKKNLKPNKQFDMSIFKIIFSGLRKSQI